MGFFFFFFLSLITPRSIFITHHSSLKIPQLPTPHPFGTITQLVITQIFQMFVGPIPVTWCSFYIFLFFCFLQPPIPKLTEPRGKKKKNLETQTHRTQWKKKKKKKKMKKTKPDPTWKGKEEKKKEEEEEEPKLPKPSGKKKSCDWTLTVGPSV